MNEDITTWEHLDPAVKKLWRIEAAIGGAVYLLMFLGFGVAAHFIIEETSLELPFHPVILGGAVGLGLFALSLYVAGKKYEFWRYEVGDDDLAVAHGIWWRTKIYVPRARIQHVDVSAGPISRALGLSVVSVFVSGHAGAVATIPGLKDAKAEELRKVLLKISETMTVHEPDMEPPPLDPESWNG